jgi:hypothetical protein
LLAELARKYIWWMTPAEASEFPARIVAQVIRLGLALLDQVPPLPTRRIE